MRLVICTDVFQLESFRKIVIYLYRTKLPCTADSILDHKVKLWSIEGSFTRDLHCFKTNGSNGINDVLLCFCKCLRITKIFFRFVRIAQRNLRSEFFKTCFCQNQFCQFKYIQKFCLHLIRCAKDMGIILCKSSYARQSMQLPTLLITIHCTKLRNANRKFFI